jgi:hypothetical protein
VNIDAKEAGFIVLAIFFLIGETMTLMDLQRRLRAQEERMRELQQFVFDRVAQQPTLRGDEE